MSPFAIAAIAFFAGIICLGLIVFFVFLLKSFASLEQELKKFYDVTGKMAAVLPDFVEQCRKLSAVSEAFAKSIQDWSQQIGGSNKQVSDGIREMVTQLKLTERSMTLLNDAIISQNDEPARPQSEGRRFPLPPGGEGSFYPPLTEEQLASVEGQEVARRHGIELDESRAFQPEKANMVGVEADGAPKPVQP